MAHKLWYDSSLSITNLIKEKSFKQHKKGTTFLFTLECVTMFFHQLIEKRSQRLADSFEMEEEHAALLLLTYNDWEAVAIGSSCEVTDISDQHCSTNYWKSSEMIFHFLSLFASFFVLPYYISPHFFFCVSPNNLFITFVLSLVFPPYHPLCLALFLACSFIVCLHCIFLFSLSSSTPTFFKISSDIFSPVTSDTNRTDYIILDAALICFPLETKHSWGQLINKPLFTFPCTEISPVTDNFNRAATPIFFLKVN